MTQEGNTSAIEVVQVGSLIQPAAEPEAIRDTFRMFERLKLMLLTDDDYQTIQGKKFPKRQAWRKLATAFSVSFEIADRTIIRDERGRVIAAEFVVRASTPNGRFAEAFAACDRWDKCCLPGCKKSGSHQHCGGRDGWTIGSGDKARVFEPCDGGRHFSHAEHDVPATAQTRATSRAAADLFGMGATPAEEAVEEQPRVDEETGEILGPTSAQKARLVALAKDKADSYHDALSRRQVNTAVDLPQSKIDELIKEVESA